MDLNLATFWLKLSQEPAVIMSEHDLQQWREALQFFIDQAALMQIARSIPRNTDIRRHWDLTHDTASTPIPEYSIYYAGTDIEIVSGNTLDELLLNFKAHTKSEDNDNDSK